MASIFIALVGGAVTGAIGGAAVGAMVARNVARQELDRAALEAERRSAAAPPAPAIPAPVMAAPVPAPAPEPVPAPAPAAVAPAPTPAPAPVEQEITPEILMVLTAAVAAFLGKRARIRSARMASRRTDGAWAQQGRVFVQASHNLPLSRH